jgi:hypothetical protein
VVPGALHQASNCLARADWVTFRNLLVDLTVPVYAYLVAVGKFDLLHKYLE